MFFISYMCKHACARKIDDIKPTVQSSRVRTRHVYNSLQMHVCISGMHMPNLDLGPRQTNRTNPHTIMQIVSQGQWNKLYKHVHVLRCNSPSDARHKSC